MDSKERAIDMETVKCKVCFDAGRVRAVIHKKDYSVIIETQACPMKCGAVIKSES